MERPEIDWDDTDATVVCRELGLAGGVAIAEFGEGDDEIGKRGAVYKRTPRVAN